MPIKKWWWAVIIIVLLAGTVAIIHRYNANQPQTTPIVTSNKVRIAYIPVVQALPLYITLDKGYFKEAGLDVETVKFEAPNQIIDALLSGQVDIGAPGTASGITAISQNKKPNSLKIFALIGGDLNTTNDELLIKKESTFKTIADLKNKKLGILPGIQFRTIAKDILNKNGLTIDKEVQIIELAVPLQLQALASGQIDALLTVEPVGTIGQAKNITKELIHAPMVQYISNPWYGAVGNIAVSYLDQQPDTAKKVMAIFEKTIKEINSDPNNAKLHLKNYTPLDDTLIAVTPLPIFKYHTNISTTDTESLQKFFDIFQANGVIDNKVIAEQLIYKQ